jgi:hypothetical protein
MVSMSPSTTSATAIRTFKVLLTQANDGESG